MPTAQVPGAGSRRRKEQHYRSVISDIFNGSILSLVQCLTCDRVSISHFCTSSHLGIRDHMGSGNQIQVCPGLAVCKVNTLPLCITPALKNDF